MNLSEYKFTIILSIFSALISIAVVIIFIKLGGTNG